MLRRTEGAVALLFLALAAVGASQGANQGANQDAPKWKDPAEYALYDAINKEAAPEKKLALLNEWKSKYAETAYERNRLAFYLAVYQQLKDNPKILQTLNQLAALDPKDQEIKKGILLFVMQSNDTSPLFLESGERAAQSFLTGPLETPARTMLGWVAMTRKNNDAAEEQFRKVTQLDSAATQVNAWLANLIYARKDVPQALFFYARAASQDWPQRQQYDQFVRKLYKQYHGEDEAGFAALMAAAKAGPAPPGDFTVRSKIALEEEAREKWEAEHPQEVLWQKLKTALTAADGAQYFENSMKGADVPGGAGGVQSFKATVLSSKPALRPKELVVAMSDAKTPEATLKLDTALAVKPETGAEIEFSGVAESFTGAPFMVTFQVQRAQIKGIKALPAHK